MKGASRSSRTCGGMRWTLMSRRTSVADAYGEVVWSSRRGAGVKLPGVHAFGDDGGKRAVLRGEHDISRKAIAQGMPECSGCSCMLVCLLLAHNCTRDRGCSKHPAFPAPSLRGKVQANLGLCQSREREIVFTRHHPRRRVIQYSRDSIDKTEKPRRTGSPAFAGDDGVNRRRPTSEP